MRHLSLSLLFLAAASSCRSSSEVEPFDRSLLQPETWAMNTPNELEPYADPAVLAHLAPVRATFGNMAVTTPSDRVNPRMTTFAQQMDRTMYEPVAGKVFLMSGWQLTSTLIVVGDGGLIVVDPGENDAAASELMSVFRETTGNTMPIRAAVFTHRHVDHPFGLRGMGVTQEMVDDGDIRIFAHHEFMDYLANDASVVGEILSQRTASAAHMFVGREGDGPVHAGLGPTFTAGPISFFPPTDIVEDEVEVEIAGVRMVVFEAYGDAEDEVCVYLPDFRHVYGAETIQGETFPNLYTLRGTRFRDPVKWYKGVDRLLEYARESDSYSHAHMRAWVGNEFIVERIRNYRDAIQFVHDQSIRHMNKGATREELVELVTLPDHLRDDPWLQEFYGTVAHSVRNIYNGYLGWYQGDATELATPFFHRKAKLYVSAMGGRDRVLELADMAMAEEDYGWAMELTTQLVRADDSDTDARQAKADAMRAWGDQQANVYWRGFALSGAGELDGTMRAGAERFEFGNPVIVQQLDVAVVLENLRVMIDADRAVDADYKVNFHITDRDERYAFHVRNGIAAFYDHPLEDADATFHLPSRVVYDFVFGRDAVRLAIEAGEAELEGDPEALQVFGGFFDFSKEPIRLTTR